MNKKIILVIIITPVIGLLTINLITMREIKTEITINAPTAEVWKILMEHETYPEWNPFIKKVEGSKIVGESLQVTVQSEGKKPMNFKPTILENKENHEFRWIGKMGMKGIFDGEHYFILEETAPNQTRFIHGEKFTGILSGILAKMILKDTEAGFNSMNKALKRLSEEE